MASQPSWSFTAPPPSSSTSTASTSQFSSSFGAFGLPQPRASPSNLSLQLESRGVGPAAVYEQQHASTAVGNGLLAPSASTSNAPPWATSTLMTSPSTSATGHARRGSMLAADAMNWEDDADPSWPSTPSGSQQGPPPALGNPAAGGTDDMMSLSPSTAAALGSGTALLGAGGGGGGGMVSFPFAYPRQSRSRSGSASNTAISSALPSAGLYPNFPAVPPSPVTIARALQAGQKTPPPFLARRLFKDGESAMQEESASGTSGRSSRSGSSSDTAAAAAAAGTTSAPQPTPRPRMTRAATLSSALVADEDEEIEELSAVLSRSASAGPEDPFERVIRRPVSRKPNLLPKTKSHLRVLTELRTESAGDQAEIASEATLFRLSRSGAVTVPAMRPSGPSSLLHAGGGNGAGTAQGSTSRSFPGAGPGGGSRPPPNRFPEQIEEDDMLSSHRLGNSSSSSNDGEMDEVAEMGSDWGGMSVGGYGTEEDEERRSNIVWNGIRSGPGGSAVTVATPTSSARSPNGSASRGMETDIPFAAPQTPSAAVGTRRGKRKLNDDRFEPYAHHAFKRRAVSPAASLSLSPGFGASGGHSTASTSSSSRPTPPPPIGNSSLSTSTLPSQSQPVTIPSPPPHDISHHQFFSAMSGTRSAANSPSATASSLSSSTGGGLGRGFLSFALSDRHKPISVVEEQARFQAQAHSASADAVSKMSLGGDAPDDEEL